MIVEMRKVTVLFLESDREAALEALYEMGVVHVVNVEEPAAGEVEQAIEEDLRQGTEAVESVRAALARRKERKGAPPPSEVGNVDVDLAEDATRSPGDTTGARLLNEAARLTADRQQIEKTIAALSAELERVGPLGDFDPALLRELEGRGLFFRWLRAPLDAHLSPPEGAVLNEIGTDEQRRYYILVASMPVDLADLGRAGEAEELRAPERPGGELRAVIEEQEGELDRIDASLAALESRLPELDQAVDELKKASEIAQVRARLGASETIRYLQGYVPAAELPALREAAAQNGWGLSVREPDPTERVPTLLNYPRVVKPMRVLFNVLRIAPDYWEADVSWAFLVFFTVFVGLLVSDAGYGIFVLGLAIFLTVRARGVRSDAVTLLYGLGLSVIVFGALSGSWLGLEKLPSFLEALKLQWFTDDSNVMELCFIIGAIHMTLAHTWTALTVFPQRRFLAQIGWVAIVWSMFFVARALVLNRPFFGPSIYMLGGGVLLVIGFLMPPARMREHLMEYVLLPLTLVGFFVDVISYIRLFAVGVASVAVAESFNGMAAGIGFDFPGVIFAAIILAFGHSLNLALALLAVLVHGVRLNTLEFSAHKGLTWSGFAFRPFGRKPHRYASGTS